MQLAMVGLGRMGANLVRRLLRAGHECVVFDLDPVPGAELSAEGATVSATIAALRTALTPPRTVWLMLPAGVTGRVLDEVVAHLEPGDIVIDGGNSNYRDDIARANALATLGIHFVDCGTSGGVFGHDRGYCLMVGGEQETFEYLEPVFRALAPGVELAGRTPGRTGEPGPEEHGYLYCGPAGAGHFVKMVHNGIEYALMASYAEGLNILHHADAGRRGTAEFDAESAGLHDPGAYQYDIDIAAVTEVWRRGSVISSWLLDLTAAALLESSTLEKYQGRVGDSGEGRWTVQAAVDEGVPAPLISAALYSRFASRGASEFADRVLSAMRDQFGGHGELRGET
ncbi:MAG: phosphogluconate dehydrogenase (NAD(+)-dependent, decarboxylating) [Actinomycetota bacterium]